jgi:hypothetical protein
MNSGYKKLDIYAEKTQAKTLKKDIPSDFHLNKARRNIMAKKKTDGDEEFDEEESSESESDDEFADEDEGKEEKSPSEDEDW